MIDTLKLKSTKSKIEIQIVDLFSKGDMRCLNLIMDNYYINLYNKAYDIMGDSYLSNEMLQDSLIKVWRFHDKYDSSKSRLYTWLCVIVRNCCLDHKRKISIKNSRECRDELSEFDNFTLDSINIDTLDIYKHLDTLVDKYRIVIYLAYIKGFTMVQISEKLTVPVGTVKSRRKIGIRELRKIYLGSN